LTALLIGCADAVDLILLQLLSAIQRGQRMARDGEKDAVATVVCAIRIFRPGENSSILPFRRGTAFANPTASRNRPQRKIKGPPVLPGHGCLGTRDAIDSDIFRDGLRKRGFNQG
jgi:hypothetical protein